MVKSLVGAIQRTRQLPESEQLQRARFTLHELDEDDAWRRTNAAFLAWNQKSAGFFVSLSP